MDSVNAANNHAKILDIALESVAAVLRERPADTNAKLAVQRLFKRVVFSYRTLRLMHGVSTHDWMADGCTILRAIYDASLQATYIVRDAQGPLTPAKREERGTEFIEFYWIEWHELVSRADRNASKEMDAVRLHPDRRNQEPARLAEFDRIKANYSLPGKPTDFRKNWYKGDLGSVAREVGATHEYDFLMKELHGPVHSSPFSLAGRGMMAPDVLIIFAGNMVLRISRCLLMAYGVPEPLELQPIYNAADKSLI